MPTELLYLRDSSLRSFEALVVDSDESGVELDKTAFYVTGGGQPPTPGAAVGWPRGTRRRCPQAG